VRVFKVMAALLDAAAAPDPMSELPLDHEPEPRLAQVAYRPVEAKSQVVAPPRLEHHSRGEPPMAAAFPTQAARAALLDRFVASE
jgi:hypothetical protein